MFGHEKGAFTGAVARQAGKFELASNGTIFLDEVGELSPTNQAKLLRVLQEHEYTPIGGKTTMTTNARVLADIIQSCLFWMRISSGRHVVQMRQLFLHLSNHMLFFTYQRLTY